MVLSETEAETRLAELRRQREAIDRAITDLTLYLELGRRLTLDVPGPVSPIPGPPGPARPPSGNGQVGSEALASAVSVGGVPRAAPGKREQITVPERPAAVGTGPDTIVAEGALARRYGRALVQAALSVLEDAGRPLHASEIAAGLGARGFTIPGQQDPVAALNTRLWKRSGPGGPIRRLGDAVYALPEGPGTA